jgi:hypothetical protein
MEFYLGTHNRQLGGIPFSPFSSPLLDRRAGFQFRQRRAQRENYFYSKGKNHIRQTHKRDKVVEENTLFFPAAAHNKLP